MTKLEHLEEDVLRALADWHGVAPDELGLHWRRLASAFARVVEFTGLTPGPRTEDDPAIAADRVASRAILLLSALGELVTVAGELAE